jgi:hypothetical protein
MFGTLLVKTKTTNLKLSDPIGGGLFVKMAATTLARCCGRNHHAWRQPAQQLYISVSAPRRQMLRNFEAYDEIVLCVTLNVIFLYVEFCYGKQAALAMIKPSFGVF